MASGAGRPGRSPRTAATSITQTERIGTFLGGSVRVIEGRGYNADGTVGFNALGIVSFNPATNSYTISSWAHGHNGVFPFRLTAEGYEWEVPAGPGATIRYTRDGHRRHLARSRLFRRRQRPAGADFRDEPAPRRHDGLARARVQCRCADAFPCRFVDAAGALVAGGCHPAKICYGPRLRNSAHGAAPRQGRR